MNFRSWSSKYFHDDNVCTKSNCWKLLWLIWSMAVINNPLRIDEVTHFIFQNNDSLSAASGGALMGWVYFLCIVIFFNHHWIIMKTLRLAYVTLRLITFHNAQIQFFKKAILVCWLLDSIESSLANLNPHQPEDGRNWICI